MHAADQSQFFITYILVAGGLQIFVRLSQTHNVFVFWFTLKVTKEEAASQRKLDSMRTTVPKFHLDEFIPLFLFIFMISFLYGWIAPISNVFVACFFKCAYKAFKYMTLYIYGNDYEGGGFLFYTITGILFFLLYCSIILLAGYFSLFGHGAMAGVSSILIFITIGVQRGINKTFKEPSQTLALTKALEFDSSRSSARDRALKEYLRAKSFLEEYENGATHRPGTGAGDDELAHLLSLQGGGDGAEESQTSNSDDVRNAVARIERRYRDDDCMSDLTGDTDDGPAADFFIYRQPSLNRATWETVPRSYWESLQKDYTEVDFWQE